MIDRKALTKRDVGRKVVYEGSAGKEYKGEIVSWDDRYIYVKYYNPEKDWLGEYVGKGLWGSNDTTGLSTISDDLEFNRTPKPEEIITRADLMDLSDD